jgi:MFS family permease
MRHHYLLFFTLFSTYFGLSMVNPLIAPMLRELRLDETQISMVFAIAAVSLFVSSLVWGDYCEKHGRRKLLVHGIFHFSFAYLLFAFVIQLGFANWISFSLLFAFLLLIRLYGGVVFGAVLTGAQALMADLTHVKERTSGMALLGAANGLGMILGPAFASILVLWDWTVPVYFAALFPLVMGWIWMRKGPDEPVRRKESHPHSEKLSLFDRRIFPYLFMTVLVHLVIVILQVTAGLYFTDQLGVSVKTAAQWISLSMFAMGTAAFLGQMVIVRLWNPSYTWLLRLGAPVMFLGFFGFLQSVSLSGMVLSFAGIGLGVSLMLPGCLSAISLNAGEESQGAAAGLSGVANGIGAMAGPVAGSFLYEVHPVVPFECCLWVLSGMIVMACLIKPQTKEHTEPVFHKR